MKSITEFPKHKLLTGIQAKTALSTEGKTPEEIMQNLGETFKLEGDKLKHFVNAIEVANQNLEGLSRLMVVSFNEGESVPPKAMKIEEFYYIPDFIVAVKPPLAATKPAKAGAGGKGKPGRGGGAPKSSPWGISPEEKAAKKGKAAKKE